MRATIITAGYTVITDLGRTSGPAFGIPVNGALDQFSARVANTLVGNRQDAPLLEITAFDMSLRPDVRMLIAVTGAEATLTIGGFEHPQWEPVLVEPGELVEVHRIKNGLRCYLAVFGSVSTGQLLGSCAPDTVLGFGTKLADGDGIDLLCTPSAIENPLLGIPFFRLPVPVPARPQQPVIEVVDGPDRDQFMPTDTRLFEAPYTVGLQSNHVGLRLSGPMPVRQTTGEILSRGVPVGAVEAPAGDQLLVLHRGRGVTAGYPVLAVVTEQGLDLMAQLRPGDTLTFRRTTVPRAARIERDRRARINRLAEVVSNAFAALGLHDNGDGDPRWLATTPTH